MNSELESLNSDLRSCIKNAINAASEQGRDSCARLQHLSMVELEAISENPAFMPVSTLYILSEALGITQEIFSILTSYELT